MATYLKHERKNLQAKMKDYYFENQDKISAEMFKSPLKELIYGRKKLSLSPSAKELVTYVNDYINSYNIKFDKDVTLEGALKQIIWLFPQ